MIDVDASYVTHIEAGRKVPSLEMFEKIAGALNLPVPVLMLLSADKKDLRGVGPEYASVLGERLADLARKIP
jgi:transcriptional regulator with XRE-family HTH domain